MFAFKGQNSGSYTWNITDEELIHNILHAKHTQLFESDPFIMAQLKWKLKLYPNGDSASNKGSVKISVELISMPPELKEVVISSAIRCNKTMSSFFTAKSVYSENNRDIVLPFGWRVLYTADGRKYYQNDIAQKTQWDPPTVDTETKSNDKENRDIMPAETIWADKILLLSEWAYMNLTDLSITVTIRINHILLNDNSNYLKLTHLIHQQPINALHYKGKSSFVHKIDNKLMNMVKTSYNEKMFSSEIGDNMWRLSYSPNGETSDCKGYFSIFLKLCFMPPFIKKLHTKLCIKCTETNAECKGVKEFTYDKPSGGNLKFMRFTNIQNLQTLTFNVDLEITDIVLMKTQEMPTYYIYDSMQINYILSLITNDMTEMKETQNNDTSEIINDTLTVIQKQMNTLQMTKNSVFAATKQNKKEIDALKEQLYGIHKNDDNKTNKNVPGQQALQSLTINVVQNNETIQQIQDDMNEIKKQINDLRLVIIEENKKEDMDDMRKELGAIKQNLNEIINEKTAKQNEENSEQEKVRKWMMNVVKLPQYIDLFIENGFESLDIMKDITMNELNLIGIDKLGHKIKIKKAIDQLNRLNNIEINQIPKQTSQTPITPQIAAADEGDTEYIK